MLDPLLSSFCFYSLSFCIQPSLFLTRYRWLQVILGTNALLGILSFICTGSLLYCCYNQLHKLKTIRSYAGLKQHRSITSQVCRSEGGTSCSRSLLWVSQCWNQGVHCFWGRIHLKAHSGCWLNLLPCSRRTEVLLPHWLWGRGHSQLLKATHWPQSFLHI